MGLALLLVMNNWKQNVKPSELKLIKQKESNNKERYRYIYKGFVPWGITRKNFIKKYREKLLTKVGINHKKDIQIKKHQNKHTHI